MKEGSVEYKKSINLEKMNKDFYRLKKLIIRAIGDTRRCPHCHKAFISNDKADEELLLEIKNIDK